MCPVKGARKQQLVMFSRPVTEKPVKGGRGRGCVARSEGHWGRTRDFVHATAFDVSQLVWVDFKINCVVGDLVHCCGSFHVKLLLSVDAAGKKSTPSDVHFNAVPNVHVHTMVSLHETLRKHVHAL